MPDAGVNPVEKFDVKPSEDGQSVIYTPKTPDNGEKPSFKGITFTSDNVEKVIIVPVNKDGKEVGEPTTVPVEKTDKPTTVLLENPHPSDSVKVTFVPRTPGDTPDAKVTSIIACMKEDG